MTPRSQPRALGFAVIAAAGLLLAVAAARPEPAVVAAPFLVASVAGWTIGGGPAAAVVVAPDRSRVLEGDEIEVRVDLTTSPSAHRVRVRLQVPPELAVLDDHRGVEDLVVDGAASVAFRVVAERWGGAGPLEVQAEVVDRVGLRRTELRGRSSALRVLPAEATLRRVLSPRSLRTVPGAHGSRHRGDGIEYADIRPFVAGDRARAVNWKVSARRGELWVDDRHPERSGEVVIFVDTFARAGLHRDDTLWRTVEAANALASRHIAANDRVGLVELGGIFRWIRPSGGTVQLHRIAEALADTEVTASEAEKPLEVIPRRALPRRSLVVALSPLLDERGIAAIARMRATGLDVGVIEVTASDVVPAQPGRRGAVAHRLWSLERDATRAMLRRRGIGVARWEPHAPLDPVVDELLLYRQAVTRWAR